MEKDVSDEYLDAEAGHMLQFEQGLLKKYGMAWNWTANFVNCLNWKEVKNLQKAKHNGRIYGRYVEAKRVVGDN